MFHNAVSREVASVLLQAPEYTRIAQQLVEQFPDSRRHKSSKKRGVKRAKALVMEQVPAERKQLWEHFFQNLAENRSLSDIEDQQQFELLNQRISFLQERFG